MSPGRGVKAPREPRQPLVFQGDDFATLDAPLFRIHKTAGPYPSAWNTLRTYGPLDRSRWDPHPLPVSNHPGLGVLYASAEHVTPFAEVSHRSGRINLTSGAPVLSGWEPTRPLRLLNLGSDWLIRNGASRALQSAPKATCRAWARAIKEQGPDNLDGLLAEGTLIKRSQVVLLWEPASPRFPSGPAFSRALTDPAVGPMIMDAVRRTGFGVVGR